MTLINCFIITLCLMIHNTFGKIYSEAYENQPVLYENRSSQLERNTNEKCNDIKRIFDLYETMNYKLDVLDDKITEKFKENKQRKTFEETMFPDIVLCKEVSVSGMFAQTHSLDSENLKFITLNRSSTGERTYFEMHIAIETDERVAIQLLENEHIRDSDIRYYIDVGRNNNQYTELQYKSKTVRRIHTPDILSSNQLKTFYIKIDDGKLEFGKEGSSSPLISYYDARFRFVNYFTFGTWGNEAKVRYDCPAPVEELPYKEVSLSGSTFSSPFLINNKTFNHISVKRNSTGHLTYFEAHIAVEAEMFFSFRLSGKGNHNYPDIRYDIDVGRDSNQNTKVALYYQSKWTDAVKQFRTPNILSPNEFTAFYLKIDDGTLKFGKEGDSTPLVSYHDAKLGSLNYFFLYNGGSKKANIRYDCPAPVQGSSGRIF